MIQLVTTTTLARKYILLIHQQEDQHMVHIHLQEDPHMVHIHLQKGREHYLNAGCCLAWLPPRLVAPLRAVVLQIMRAAVLLHIGGSRGPQPCSLADLHLTYLANETKLRNSTHIYLQVMSIV